MLVQVGFGWGGGVSPSPAEIRASLCLHLSVGGNIFSSNP